MQASTNSMAVRVRLFFKSPRLIIDHWSEYAVSVSERARSLQKRPSFPAPRFCDRRAPGPRIRCLVRNLERKRGDDQKPLPTSRAAGNSQHKQTHWTAYKPLVALG